MLNRCRDSVEVDHVEIKINMWKSCVPDHFEHALVVGTMYQLVIHSQNKAGDLVSIRQGSSFYLIYNRICFTYTVVCF